MLKNKSKSIITDNTAIWTNEMETLFKANTIIDLKKILKDKGLLLSGTKKTLVYRIINDRIITDNKK